MDLSVLLVVLRGTFLVRQLSRALVGALGLIPTCAGREEIASFQWRVLPGSRRGLGPAFVVGIHANLLFAKGKNRRQPVWRLLKDQAFVAKHRRIRGINLR